MRWIFFIFMLLAIFYSAKAKCVHRGECPQYTVRCMIACLPETSEQQCANDPLCCTKDSQCPRHQKCCQPACGCHHQCLNATYTKNT